MTAEKGSGFNSVEDPIRTTSEETRLKKLKLISDHFSRRRETSFSTAANRPLWIKDISLLCANIERDPIERQRYENRIEDIADPISHLSSKLRVITRSPATRNRQDVEDLYQIFRSVAHFRPGFGYNEKDGGLFVKNLRELVDSKVQLKGFEISSAVSLFKVWEGVATLNSSLLPMFFSSEEVAPLEGLKAQFLHKNSWLVKKEEKSSFLNMLDFSNKVIANLELIKDQEEIIRFAPLLKSVRHFRDYLTIVGDQEEAFDVMRPAVPQSVYIPTMLALGEHFDKVMDSTDHDSKTPSVEDIAKALVSTIRCGRLALDRDSLLSLFIAFRNIDQIDMENVTPVLMDHASRALDAFDVLFKNVELNKADRIKSVISNEVIPALILQLRCLNYSIFNWEKEDYKLLGFESLWDEHDKVLQGRTKRPIPGPEIMESGNIQIDGSGQWFPPTVAHIELLREISRISVSDLLESSNLGIFDENDQVVTVGLSVNHGNPDPRKMDWPERERWLATSLKVSNNLFIWPTKPKNEQRVNDGKIYDTQGPRWIKLQGHLTSLKEANREPYLRMMWVGTDKLNQQKLMFTQEEEEEGWQELNKMCVVLALQRDELREPAVLFEKLRQLYENFRTPIIIFPRVPDVHSSYFNRKHLPKYILSTLVDPEIIDDVIRTQERINTIQVG